MRWLLRAAGLVVVAAILGFAGLAAIVASYGQQTDPGPADAAVVLGAAVLRTEPSPVFAERLRHAAELYKAGAVRKVVVSGGLAQGDKLSEAVAGRDWLVAQGVPAADILTEDQSHTTFQNLENVKPILAKVIEAAETAETGRLRNEAMAAIEDLKRKGPGYRRDISLWGQVGEGALAVGCIVAAVAGQVEFGVPCVIGGVATSAALRFWEGQQQ